MAKPREKTGSTAPRPIAPPPLSQHLRELASRPHAWGVLARNLIPVVGIYCFGWSAALTVFNYWFDGLTALAAIVAALIPGALGYISPGAARAGDVHDGRPRPHFRAADGAGAELSRDLARARARCGLWRSVAAVRIRS